MKLRPSKKVCLYFINLVIIFLYALGGLVFVLEGKPFIRGFYCNDESIMKPYPIKQTIPALECIVAVAVVSIIVILFVEVISLEDINAFLGRDKKQLKAWGTDVICVILLCIYGLGITLFVTDIGKYSIGRLRPHFIDVCKPDWSRINCTNNYGIKQYITGDSVCTTDNLKRLKEARISFPSGHSSISGFGAMFLILYIEYRVTCVKEAVLGKLFIQVLLACGAFYIGLTRVSDYMHHPTDILAGFVVGIAIATVLYYVVLRSFFPEKTRHPHPSASTDLVSAGCKSNDNLL